MALVVASQCEPMGRLENLDEAARNLREVLLDPRLGFCTDAVDDHPQPSPEGELTPRDVEAAVRHAIERARDSSATLILAFLGHGFTGDDNALYFMCQGSEPDVLRKSVNVSQLLNEAIFEPGVESLAVIVDTCHAGEALPMAATALIARAKHGSKNVAALAGAAPNEPAYRLRFSTALAEVLREGVAKVDDSCPVHLTAASVIDVVRPRTPGQRPVTDEFNGSSYSSKPWLAFNACHPGFDRQAAPRAPGAHAVALSRSDVQDLVERLMAIPVMTELASAQWIIGQLPDPIPRLVIEPAETGLDLTELIRTMEEYPAAGAWSRLIEELMEATAEDEHHVVDAFVLACRGLNLVE
ncbi:caspase family protein [Actinoplanes sp. NPDC023714]|uniref:caspase family protein n=1 Tax=Actinoplanes sp. NPDC023714 TaxID=3154322 RepID=UPI0033FB899F